MAAVPFPGGIGAINAGTCFDIVDGITAGIAAERARLATLADRLNAIRNDTNVCQGFFCNPNLPCFNEDACQAYRDMQPLVGSALADLANLNRQLDTIAALAAAIDCNNVTPQRLRDLRERCSDYSASARGFGDDRMDYLYLRGRTLRQIYSRECMGNGAPPDIYGSDPGNEAICMIDKERLLSELNGPGGLISDINNLRIRVRGLIKTVEAAIRRYTDLAIPSCVSEYADILAAVQASNATYAPQWPTLVAAVGAAINAIDCSAADWQDKVDAANATIGDLHITIVAAEASLGTPEQTLDNIQGSCPLTGVPVLPQ